MTSYFTPSIVFKKEWRWFELPLDTGADIVNVFSYDRVDAPGFKRKEGITTVIDLTRDEETLWGALRKKFVREQIQKGERNGISVSVGIHWEEFVPVYEEFREGKQVVRDDPRVFKHCLVAGAYHGGILIAGGVFVHDTTNIRALALASRRFNDDGKMRELVGQANRMVIWETMRFAKKHGYRSFDLGGIAPESDDRGERTLAEFKESFGGERKPCYYYTKVNSPILRLWLKMQRFLRI